MVVDFLSYPRLFPELREARVMETDGKRVRVEFRAQVVVPARYVLDLLCDPEALTVDWNFVEGDIVTNSSGGWRLRAEGSGTFVEYSAALEVRAPLPGFVLRKITDILLSASIPGMFAALTREVEKRKATQG